MMHSADCDDDRCLVLFGIILDSASKIRLEAEKRLKILEAEMAKHGFEVEGFRLTFRVERLETDLTNIFATKAPRHEVKLQ